MIPLPTCEADDHIVGISSLVVWHPTVAVDVKTLQVSRLLMLILPM